MYFSFMYPDQTPQRVGVEGGVDLADVDGEEEGGEHRGRPEGEVEEAARHPAVVEVDDAAHDRAQLPKEREPGRQWAMCCCRCTKM